MRALRCFFFLCFLILSLAWAATVEGRARWARTLGSPTEHEELVTSTEVADGGFVAAGYAEIAFPNMDLLLLKADPNGTSLWQRTIGGAGYEYANHVRSLSDGGFVVAGVHDLGGATWGDGWLLRFGAAGNLLWQRTYGGPAWDELNSVFPTTDGGFLVSGFTRSYGAGSEDALLIKTDANGAVIWATCYGGAQDDRASYAESTADGGCLLSGRTKSWTAGDWDVWVVKTDKWGAVTWANAYGGSQVDRGSARQLSDGSLIVSGYEKSFGSGMYDGFLMKLTSTGAFSWANAYGGPGDDLITGRATSYGEYVLSGLWTNSPQVCGVIAKTDAAGGIEWQRRYGGDTDTAAYAIEVSTGGYVACGTAFFGTNRDALLFRTSSTGDLDDSCGGFVQPAALTTTPFAPTVTSATVTVTPLSMTAGWVGDPLVTSSFTVTSICSSPDMPDLTGEFTQLKKRGSRVTGKFQCKNIGSLGAGAFTVKIYFSRTATTGKRAMLITTKNVTGLAAGGTTNIRISGVPSGKHKNIVAVLDTAGVIVEESETNNTIANSLP